MMKRYMILILSVGTLFFSAGCSDLDEEIKKYVASHYGDGDLIADDGSDGAVHDDDNNTDDGGTDGSDDNGTDGNDDTPDVEEPQRVVSTVKEEETRRNWYVSLRVEDLHSGLRFKGAKLGEFDEVNATQTHALKALNPFGGAFIDIVFEDPKGQASGSYASYFLQTDPDQEQRWRFKVRSSDDNADIRLQWRGLFILDPYVDAQHRTRYKEHMALHHSLWRHMKLIDLETQEEIPVQADGRLVSYQFSMGGSKERTFEWLVLPEVIPAVTNSQKQSKRVAERVSPQRIQRYEQAEMFDLDHPPTIEESK